MSGVAGADRIKSRQDFQQFLASYKQLISKFPGFVSIQPSGSYNSDANKMDFGDIDLITHIKSTKNKKEVKLELVHFFEKLPDTQIVAFTSDKHAGKRSYNSGEIVTVRYHDDVLGYSAQIDNIIALDHIEAGFKQQFLDMPAEKQGLVLGLVKIATVETDPKQLFAKLNIRVPVNLAPNQEFEFNLSSSELQLRKVTYEPGTFKQADREILWRSQNYADLQKLLYQYDLSQGFDQLLAASQATIQNPRSKNRMQGVFGSMITVKSGEVGTAKGANKVAALDKIKNTFNESVFNALVESNGGTMVFAFGRFNPPTIGHELLVNTVQKVAGSHKAAYAIYVSRTQDKKKNPLPLDSKLHYLKQMFPGVHFVGASDEVRTFMEAAKSFDGKFKNLIMVAGGDRVPVFEETLLKYNHIEYHFDSIQVVSAGARDPDADDASGASGTKMREYAVNNDLQSFLSQLPRTMDEHTAQQMMNEIRTAMGVKQEVPMAESRLQELIAETKRMSAAVKLQKAYQREQDKSAASRERGNNIMNPKKASETPKPVGAGSGKVKMSEDHQTSRIWMIITNLEKQAKLTKNDIKRDHLLRMADDLRAKLPSNDQSMGEGRKANTASARAELGKRKKKVDPVEQGKKQSEQDAAWERLQAHMNKPENMAVLKRLSTKEDVSRRGFLKGAGAAAMGAAAGDASAIAGAFPSPSTREKWAKDAAASNAAEARRQAELQRQANAAKAAKLDADTKDVDRLNKVSYHGKDAPKPTNAEWDGDSDFLDLDGTQYAMASRMPISGDEPSDMKLISTKQGRQVYIWTRRSLKGTHGRYFYPAANPKTIQQEADKHSIVGKIQRGHELKKKVDSTWKDIGNAQKKGDKAAGSKAFRKHERYANLERPGTWTKADEGDSKAMAQTAKRLTDPNDGKTAKLRAAGDKRREEHLKGRDIAKKDEAMLPKSAFAGSKKNKLGPAGQWKNTGPSKNRPAKAGDLVGGAEESIQHEGKKKGADGKACWKNYKYAGTENGKDKCVPIGETAENILGKLIKILESK